ncbi:methyl-accepting chemotaxis protein [Chitinimonas arctica]|uniref:Methyl-accepting chemotaxis protein n=1 Tax=Chitinimonas arctica TaxID=2594795 RepID=A0A516SDT8_9NEIS|nr:methyl-accepting chemotaxis protein [Chitinimonas arctica]QDQ26323.1 methyl-accepting chemotaxis protein [Chitinimonas arctica]
MSIGKRLVLMLVLALVAQLIVGIIGISAFRALNDQVKSLTEISMPSVQATSDIAIAYREQRAMLLAHIMEQDVDLKKAFNQKVDEAVSNARKAVDGYANLVTDDTDKANYAALKIAFDSYSAGYKEALDSSNQGKNDQAVAALYGKVLPAEQVVQAAIQKTSSYNLKRQEGSAADAERVYRQALTTFMVVNVIGITLLSVFGWLIYRAITKPLAIMKQTVERIGSDLDFTQRVPISSHDEVGKTVLAFNRLLDTLQSSFRDIAAGVDGVAAQAHEMAKAAQQMSQNSASGSESAANMAATVEQVTVSINHVADRAGEATTVSRHSGDIATDGEVVIKATVGEINGIAERVAEASAQIDLLARESASIGAVVSVIKDVADQTNLLALNAAIEAARAGEQGRGFAVVADEVRKLAERTSVSTQEIGTLIATIQQGADAAVARMREVVSRVDSGVQKANQAGGAIQQIRAGSSQVLEMVEDISHAIREQSAASTNIAQQVERIAHMSEQTSGAAGDTAEAANQLQQLATQMQVTVSRYRV